MWKKITCVFSIIVGVIASIFTIGGLLSLRKGIRGSDELSDELRSGQQELDDQIANSKQTAIESGELQQSIADGVDDCLTNVTTTQGKLERLKQILKME